jgi:hypothetical protein
MMVNYNLSINDGKLDFVDFYTHLTYILYMPFLVAFFSATIDGRNLIFGHKLHIGTPYHGKRLKHRGQTVYPSPRSPSGRGGIMTIFLQYTFILL